jgi:hypothetical protein
VIPLPRQHRFPRCHVPQSLHSSINHAVNVVVSTFRKIEVASSRVTGAVRLQTGLLLVVEKPSADRLSALRAPVARCYSAAKQVVLRKSCLRAIVSSPPCQVSGRSIAHIPTTLTAADLPADPFEPTISRGRDVPQAPGTPAFDSWLSLRKVNNKPSRFTRSSAVETGTATHPRSSFRPDWVTMGMEVSLNHQQ